MPLAHREQRILSLPSVLPVGDRVKLLEHGRVEQHRFGVLVSFGGGASMFHSREPLELRETRVPICSVPQPRNGYPRFSVVVCGGIRADSRSSSRSGTPSLLCSACRRQCELGPHGRTNVPGFGVLRWIPHHCQDVRKRNSVLLRRCKCLLLIHLLIRCWARDPFVAGALHPTSFRDKGRAEKRRRIPITLSLRRSCARLHLSRDRTKTRAEVFRATMVCEVERQSRIHIHSSSDRATSSAAHRSRGRWCDHALQVLI